MIHRQRTGNMPLSASIGHATCPPGTLHDAILHADQRMYETKRQRPSVAMAARTERRNRDA
jgi:GGDEF domain-containing protein